MSGFVPRSEEQRLVIESEAPLTVVLGGAGVGKTACALAAAQNHLATQASHVGRRVLFLSFSRASVGSILGRAGGVLEGADERVDVLTFHALAWSIVRRFGPAAGEHGITLVSPARERVGAPAGSIGYNRLIPLALHIIRTVPAVRHYLSTRWTLVIVDEFQDTDDLQVELLDELAPNARRMLLGDPDQCIYTFRASDGVRLERILDACSAAGDDNTIRLPETSHRDPTQLIPSVARDIQRRRFDSEAIAEALRTQRLQVQETVPLDREVAAASKVIRELRGEGLEVAVLTHHNDVLASLSDGLDAEGVAHEMAGLNDALSCALDAQIELLRYSHGDVPWEAVLDTLAVFVTSAQRSKEVPALAQDILRSQGSPAVQRRLGSLEASLRNLSLLAAVDVACSAHTLIGLPNKSAAWTDASTLLRSIYARAASSSARRSDTAALLKKIHLEAKELVYSALTDSVSKPHAVQLMNLFQTKGREADATLVILRDGDNMGYEGKPWTSTSRLLYVVFSRARHRIVILPVGDALHPSVAPLARIRP